jgi:hypothetical protein
VAAERLNQGAAPVDAQAVAQTIARAEQLAHWLDARFKLPFLPIRFGWDAIVSVVPLVGDLASSAIGLGILHEARRIDAPRPLQLRMLANLGIDAVIGFVPFIGGVFDVLYPANLRNLALLLRHVEKELEERNRE